MGELVASDNNRNQAGDREDDARPCSRTADPQQIARLPDEPVVRPINRDFGEQSRLRRRKRRPEPPLSGGWASYNPVRVETAVLESVGLGLRLLSRRVRLKVGFADGVIKPLRTPIALRGLKN